MENFSPKEFCEPPHRGIQADAPAGRLVSWRNLAGVLLLVVLATVGLESTRKNLLPFLPQWEWRLLRYSLSGAVWGAVTYVLVRRHSKLLDVHTQGENKLALERNLLQTVTDNIPDSIFAKDRQGRYVFVNRAFTKLHGAASPDELLGRSAFDLFPRERATQLHAADLEVMQGDGTPVEASDRWRTPRAT